MIAVDWGTTNFRAFRLDKAGQILERRAAAAGILSVQDGRFEETLLLHIGDWLAAGESRVLLSGMIGSRQGWVETGYLSCPVGISELAGGVVSVPCKSAETLLIPGVMGVDADGVPEVMRGEETEAAGIMDSCDGSALLCLPGTHSKWIQISYHAIASLLTCMTGDVFGALRKSTILGRTMTMDAALDKEAFLRGVSRSAEDGGLLHHLFGVRSLHLMKQLDAEASESYLSGLLIGHEVRTAMPVGARVRLCGSTQLALIYAMAIQACGGSYNIEDENGSARGLAAIARRLSWISVVG